ncbi:hypothetical protein B5807_07134 [Epicoccum nigrum]|jgi:hypothetical protein|uniref:GPI anchored cell wall protein n=1 Tax=Epicoccum nigrum TaxID=105696 RepID=A0A1Y2LYV9_EPING|nr:hypothetical protein B5807_07134 [Epicoccum nigrum]
MTSALVLASLLGFATAQTTTLSIPFYLADNQAIEASIVSANDAATTLALNCPSGTDASDCGLFPTMLLTYGPSTYHIDMGAGDDSVFTGYEDCQRGATVTCTEFATGSEANFPGTTTATYEGAEIITIPVTVTAGADKLGSAQATETASSSASGAASGSSASASMVSASTASVTRVGGSNTASASGATHTHLSTTPSTGASVAMSSALNPGLVGVAMGLIGGLFL